ncbi:hypothetical protein FNAPI_8492 [Fusarium napiforme]|uniref:Uncharacterized protein n=1 Tax=Fusarium napiforme TaxID=42672 RepID=A0A8H5J3N3_9HYPO|nr:hypothetical protein FNAPI_8492 [Fusarium napiforme]
MGRNNNKRYFSPAALPGWLRPRPWPTKFHQCVSFYLANGLFIKLVFHHLASPLGAATTTTAAAAAAAAAANDRSDGSVISRLLKSQHCLTISDGRGSQADGLKSLWSRLNLAVSFVTFSEIGPTRTKKRHQLPEVPATETAIAEALAAELGERAAKRQKVEEKEE